MTFGIKYILKLGQWQSKDLIMHSKKYEGSKYDIFINKQLCGSKCSNSGHWGDFAVVLMHVYL